MRGLVLGAIALAVCACGRDTRGEAQQLGGVLVAAETIREGREVYQRYCECCHGMDGDGHGPAAAGLDPPARDFRTAKFKFAGVQDRGLPSDAELERIITGGLPGTAMRAWQLQRRELHAVVQYVKSFSEDGKGFRSERLEVKPPSIPGDPFVQPEDHQEAIVRGRELYHAVFQCSSCHPAYAGAAEHVAWQAAMRPSAPFDSVPKWSENYGNVLLPPDFLRHPLRSIRTQGQGAQLSHSVQDLYRAIAFGLQGPMPGFGHLGESDVWAVAHYVKELADMRESDAGRRLRQQLLLSTQASSEPVLLPDAP